MRVSLRTGGEILAGGFDRKILAIPYQCIQTIEKFFVWKRGVCKCHGGNRRRDGKGTALHTHTHTDTHTQREMFVVYIRS